MALVIIQWGTISSRMFFGTRGASKEIVPVQRRRSTQPRDCADAAFEFEEILVILSRTMMSDFPTKGSDDKFFTLTS